MTEKDAAATHCSRCGDAASGRFCSGCGAPLHEADCAGCGKTLEAGARFCNECGTAVGAPVAKSSMSDTGITKAISVAAVLMLVAFVAGQALGRRSAAPAGSAEQAGAPLSSTASAPDISNMSPEERANRLFNRVMSYAEQGKTDSARFFAPMAIQAYQMIGPLDAHARYDIGEISAAVGEGAMAKVEADSILASQPNHLLGLALAIRAAELTGDAKAASGFRTRLVAAAKTERAKDVKEYVEHGSAIDAALKKASATP
jgi:hypothetical protein